MSSDIILFHHICHITFLYILVNIDGCLKDRNSSMAYLTLLHQGQEWWWSGHQPGTVAMVCHGARFISCRGLASNTPLAVQLWCTSPEFRFEVNSAHSWSQSKLKVLANLKSMSSRHQRAGCRLWSHQNKKQAWKCQIAETALNSTICRVKFQAVIRESK